MAMPGRVDVEFGAITQSFSRGVTGVKNEMGGLLSEANRVGGAMPQAFEKTTESAHRTGQAIQRVTVDTKAMTLSMVGLSTTMIGLYTATSRLGQAENRLEKSKVAVRRINDQIASTQKNLNRLIDQGKTNTEDYTVQLGRLETAYIDLETKQTDIKLNQDVLNDTYILFATTIANTAINSLFLMKSAFAGLSLSQIKASITTKLFGGTVAATSAPVRMATVGVKGLTWQTRIFGVALKTALPPLIAITAAFAAWEGLIAPYIKEQTGTNLSLIDFADSVFAGKEALEKTNPELERYKQLQQESADVTDDTTDALKNLFDLIGDSSTHPMVKFWTAVKLKQDGVLANLVEIKKGLNDPQIRGLGAGFSEGSVTGAVGGSNSPAVQSERARTLNETVLNMSATDKRTFQEAVIEDVAHVKPLTPNAHSTGDAFGSSIQGKMEQQMKDLRSLHSQSRLAEGFFTASLKNQNLLTINTFPPSISYTPEELAAAERSPIHAMAISYTRRGLIPVGLYEDAVLNIQKAYELALRLGLPAADVLADFGHKLTPAKIDTSIFKAPEISLRDSTDPVIGPILRLTNRLANYETKAEEQGFLSGNDAREFNDVVKKLRMKLVERDHPGFFGTNTGSANDFMKIGGIYGFGSSDNSPMQAYQKQRGIDLLLKSQNGAFGRVGGGGIFEIFRGLFTTRGMGQDSRIQRMFRNLPIARENLAQSYRLLAGLNRGDDFSRAALGGQGSGTGIRGDTIEQLLGSQEGYIPGNRGLEFDEDGNLISASGLIGSTRHRARNRLTLHRLRIKAQERTKYLNSEEFLIENQLKILFGGGKNFVASRSQGDIMKRGGGLSNARAMEAILGGILRMPHIMELTKPLQGTFSGLLGGFNNTAHHNIREVIKAAASFRGNIREKDAFLPANLLTMGPRIAEFVVRSVQRRPIWIKEVSPFAERIGVTKERLQETMATLDTNIATEFQKDNIDTRNEVLRLEGRAYFIEREEASSIA